VSVNVTKHAVHFSVDGEFITDTARNILLSDDPRKAWRLLAQSLVGEGSERAARAILDGTKCLVGINNFQLVDEYDTTAEYRNQLRYIYAGRIRVDGRWWRPRARIVDVGEDDARYAYETTGIAAPIDLPDNRKFFVRWTRARIEFYAATQYDFTHNFGTRAVQVEIFRNSSPWDTILCDVSRPDTNTVRVNFAVAPTSNQFTYVITA
jgi:hypothetical protein